MAPVKRTRTRSESKVVEQRTSVCGKLAPPADICTQVVRHELRENRGEGEGYCRFNHENNRKHPGIKSKLKRPIESGTSSMADVHLLMAEETQLATNNWNQTGRPDQPGTIIRPRTTYPDRSDPYGFSELWISAPFGLTRACEAWHAECGPEQHTPFIRDRSSGVDQRTPVVRSQTDESSGQGSQHHREKQT